MDETFKEKIMRLTEKMRMAILFVVFGGMFYLLSAKLFDLQIVNGKQYQPPAVKTSVITTQIAAPRGEIYDRYGRPLALNETIYTVNIDPSAKVDDLNGVLLRFVRLMEGNGEEIINDFKISEPADGEQMEFLFNNSEARKNRWFIDMGIEEENNTPELAYAQLLEFFDIPEQWTAHEKYMVVSLRSAIYMQRFSLNHFEVAADVKPETIIVLEEQNLDFGGIYVELSYLRVYPQGIYASHIIGYIRPISQDELAKNKDLGYENTDLFGRDGIEKFYELNLRGTPGERSVQIASDGRRVAVEDSKEPVKGDTLILTIDIELQKKAYHILEDKLREILLSKLSSAAKKEERVTAKQLIISMTTANTISVPKIMSSDYSDHAYLIRAHVIKNITIDDSESDGTKEAKEFIISEIENGGISLHRMILVMYEQGIITLTQSQIDSLSESKLDPLTILVEKIECGEITPHMTNLDPCTGSVIVVDVNTGDVLASVTYPSYDNNELVNELNAEYFTKLNNDPTNPMINRPFAEKRAPGSTFKMITAAAALETNTITTTDKIYDQSVFTKAGLAAKCWSGGSHGSLNVSDALEVSCNYFFYETMFRMGNTQEGTRLEAIDKLNEYMIKFGLNDPTGVEIYEPSGLENILNISSPSLKKYRENTSWVDGDTIRTGIGQALNAYTAASMVKYTATLANGGTRYQMHFLNSIESSLTGAVTQFTPVVELETGISQSTLDAIYKGMLQVTGVLTGTGRGTGRRAFQDFPIQVAGKTGTAEQSGGASHVSFAGFAPFDDPQVAIYVSIPRGDVSTVSTSGAYVARDVLAAYFGFDSSIESPAAVNTLVP